MNAINTGKTTNDGLAIYDLDPQAAELWAIAGPDGIDPCTIDADDLPEGFRWVTESEWAALQDGDTDYSIVADHVSEYRYATDSEHGVMHARDFAEAKMMLAQELTDDVVFDGGWGWVEDVDGSRFEIGNVTR